MFTLATTKHTALTVARDRARDAQSTSRILADSKCKQVRVIREITELKSLNVKLFLIKDNNGRVIQLFPGRVD